MPIERDKASGSFVFVFDRRIGGQRVRARKRLPRAWNQAQADAFERHESARLYAIATRTPGAHHLIDDAVTLYLKERVPHLKAGLNAARELALMLPYYQGRPIDALADVCAAYRLKATRDDGTPLAAATVRNRIRYLTAACRYAWKVHGIGDADPGARGDVLLVDTETGDGREVTLTPALVARFRDAHSHWRHEVEGFCKARRVAYAQADVEGALEEQVLNLFRRSGLVE